jgi:hypothetical protein
MKQNLSPLRPAMTAIAAVIALSSTPLLAQATDGTADQATPVVVAPTVTAPPAAAQAAVPDIVAPAVAAPTLAPVMQTVGTPVVHDADTAPTSQSAVAPTRSVPVKHISTAPSARASVSAATAPATTASVTPAKVDTAPAPLPAPVAKSVPTAAQTAASTPPAAAPAPAVTASQTTHASAIDEDALPIAGGAGLAVILLGGAVAYGVNRRRRERREDALVLEPVAAVAVPEAEPVVVAKATPTPKTARGRMPKTLPNGFDISRFGRHTQAAYLGPTEDNPSFSLKRRLKRASFFDQREREAAAAGQKVVKTAPAEAPAAQVAAAKQSAKDDGQVTIRLAPQRKRSGVGYLLQR